MMKAMVIDCICDLTGDSKPLSRVRLPVPEAGVSQVLIEVAACGVCHTELDEIEGRTPPARLRWCPGIRSLGAWWPGDARRIVLP